MYISQKHLFLDLIAKLSQKLYTLLDPIDADCYNYDR